MNDIALDIGQMVIDGVGPRQGESLGSGLTVALQRLLEQRGLPPDLATHGRAEIAGLHLNLPPHASEERMAHEIAVALYGALYTVR